MIPKDDPKNIFGWCMYDWANSAYATTVYVGVLPAYFASVVVSAEGLRIGGIETSASAVWAFAVALSSFIAFLSAPVLGAISDFSAAKKRFLLAFAYEGSLFTMLLYFCGRGDVYLTLFLFLIAQVGFIGANVFYDSFIINVASPEKMDWISGKGYSYGYVGGGLQFAFALALVAGHDFAGISEETAARIAILMAGLWWAGFTLFTVKYLRETAPAVKQSGAFRSFGERKPGLAEYVSIGMSRTIRTTRRIRQFRHLAVFLLAFMLYNDGIDTVIAMSSIYGTEELKLSKAVYLITLLAIHIIATFYALIFSLLVIMNYATRDI